MAKIKVRVLLVDDNDDLRESVREGLEASGFDVYDVNSGSSALFILKKRPGEFDIVLSDVEMPDGTGPWLIAEMKKSGIKLPVILASGSIEMDLNEGLRLGAVHFVEKPARMGMLAELLNSFADGNIRRKLA